MAALSAAIVFALDDFLVPAPRVKAA